MLSAAADSDSKPEKQAINKLTERLPARSSEAIEGGHEGGEKGTFGGADPARAAVGGERHEGGRHLPRARDQRSDLLRGSFQPPG